MKIIRTMDGRYVKRERQRLVLVGDQAEAWRVSAAGAEVVVSWVARLFGVAAFAVNVDAEAGQ